MAATKAFVLIETTVGKTKDVVSALHKVDGVTSVDVVTGPYDVICVVQADDLSSVGGHGYRQRPTPSAVSSAPSTCLAVGD